jgi:hypothetical protein
MWVSIAPSLIAISPPHTVSEDEASPKQAEDCDGPDQVGGDVSDFHLGSPCLLVRIPTIQPRAPHATEKMRLTQNNFTNRQIEPKHRRTP